MGLSPKQDPLMARRLALQEQPTSGHILGQGLKRMAPPKIVNPNMNARTGAANVGPDKMAVPQQGWSGGAPNTAAAAHQGEYYANDGTAWHQQNDPYARGRAANAAFQYGRENLGGAQARTAGQQGSNTLLGAGYNNSVGTLGNNTNTQYSQPGVDLMPKQGVMQPGDRSTELRGTGTSAHALTGGGPTNNSGGQGGQVSNGQPAGSTNSNIGTSAQGMEGNGSPPANQQPPVSQPGSAQYEADWENYAAAHGYQQVYGSDSQPHWQNTSDGTGSGKSGNWHGEPGNPGSWSGNLKQLRAQYEQEHQQSAEQQRQQEVENSPYNFEVQAAPQFDTNKLKEVDAATRAKYLQEQGRLVRASAQGAGRMGGVDPEGQLGRMGDITSSLAAASAGERANQKLQLELANFQSEQQHYQNEFNRLMALAGNRANGAMADKAFQQALLAQQRADVASKNMMEYQNQIQNRISSKDWAGMLLGMGSGAVGGFLGGLGSKLGSAIGPTASNPSSVTGGTGLSGGAQASQAYAAGDTSGAHQRNYVLYGNPDGYHGWNQYGQMG